MDTPALTPYIKPGQRLVMILDDGQTHPCRHEGCTSPVVRIMVESTDPPDPDIVAMFGEDNTKVDKYVHADGAGDHHDLGGVYPQERCPKCRAYSSMNHRDTGYGEARACRTQGCGFGDYHDRGD